MTFHLFRLRRLVWLTPTLVILVTGCITHRPTLSTWRDSTLTPTRADKIALTPQLNPSPETAALGRLLTAELQREGFHLVPADQADYLMAYALEDELVNQGRTIAITTAASPPQTTAQVMDETPPGGYSSDPTIPARAVSQPVVYRNRGIRLFLYNNPKTHPGGFRIVWQGYISSGLSASPQRETILLKTLLGYLGQEYHGPVRPAQ